MPTVGGLCHRVHGNFSSGRRCICASASASQRVRLVGDHWLPGAVGICVELARQSKGQTPREILLGHVYFGMGRDRAELEFARPTRCRVGVLEAELWFSTKNLVRGLVRLVCNSWGDAVEMECGGGPCIGRTEGALSYCPVLNFCQTHNADNPGLR